MINQAVKWILVSLVLTACSGEPGEYGEYGEPTESGNLDEKIEYLIDGALYETALEVLNQEDSDDPEVRALRERTHLNYGLHNMNTFDEREMRTRMNDALRQFIEVLRINPRNEVARNNIEQILLIYRTIPDRQPEEDVIEGLREVGIRP